ncbi:AlpA family phage regulatory protein [Burkholderia sp. 9120]|uniref:helix-turn-helix transcriptional regulator n=1 Tax=Burkholderia sp. 9120 TaxID=1500897 RepID=UPI001E3CB8D3|nr:AlpA family phage regulatory protein [Burkholderia sp. 9120]
MPARVELPPDEVIDCWTLIREIGKAVVPDLNPKATGIECVVAKKPTVLGVAGIGDVQFVEQHLTDDDRRYLLRVLPDLPELRIPYSDDVVDAFLKAYRALPDGPSWEPVLLTESRYLREYDRLIGLRWQASGEHLQVLQHWLDTDRIKAFRRKHVPAIELTIGTSIPRQDAQKYLDYCGIGSTAAESSAPSSPQTANRDIHSPGGELTVPAEAGSPGHNRSSRSGLPAGSPVLHDAPEQVLVDQAVGISQPAAIPSGPLLDIKEVSERTGISVSMLHEKMKPSSKYYDGNFPPKIPLGERTVRYSRIAVDAWIQQHLSATKK